MTVLFLFLLLFPADVHRRTDRRVARPGRFDHHHAVQPGLGAFAGDQAVETTEHYTLLAIPFFLLAGAFMTTGGVARRLIDFANACVGHIRGGLAIGAVLACMLFAALSGSSPATVRRGRLHRHRRHGPFRLPAGFRRRHRV